MSDDDAECPYCGAGVEICHDDNYGYEELKQHEQECPKCGKVFGYWTSISFDYLTVPLDKVEL
jgi:ribosomal protein S27AE